MSQNKLQDLTDKLYKEGLSKGQAEAVHLVAQAKDEAAKIVAAAKDEAEQITADAHKAADTAKTTAESEIRLATRQTMAAVKQAIENAIITKATAEPVKDALTDKEFLQQAIVAAVGKFDAAQQGATLWLPDDLQQFAKEQLQKQLNGTVDIQFGAGIKAGFKIGPKDGGYHISLTDKDFESLFGAALRPHIRTLLFETVKP
jgi:V/A-type H+-transporting ATPase subunit E